MKSLRSALRARYNADGRLVRLGRVLKWGFKGDAPSGQFPCVDCTYDEEENLDTFTSDVTAFKVVFTMFSKSPEPDDCDDWLEAMTDVFDDGKIEAAGCISVGCVRTGTEYPWHDDGVYRCRATWRVILQRSSNLPVTRGT